LNPGEGGQPVPCPSAGLRVLKRCLADRASLAVAKDRQAACRTNSWLREPSTYVSKWPNSSNWERASSAAYCTKGRLDYHAILYQDVISIFSPVPKAPVLLTTTRHLHRLHYPSERVFRFIPSLDSSSILLAPIHRSFSKLTKPSYRDRALFLLPLTASREKLKLHIDSES
jgi:hypothetical protein